MWIVRFSQKGLTTKLFIGNRPRIRITNSLSSAESRVRVGRERASWRLRVFHVGRVRAAGRPSSPKSTRLFLTESISRVPPDKFVSAQLTSVAKLGVTHVQAVTVTRCLRSLSTARPSQMRRASVWPRCLIHKVHFLDEHFCITDNALASEFICTRFGHSRSRRTRSMNAFPLADTAFILAKLPERCGIWSGDKHRSLDSIALDVSALL